MEEDKESNKKKNSSSVKKTSKIKNMSFEDSLNYIENIANQLERGDLSLKDTVIKYKEAITVLDHASILLTVVKKELQLVDSLDEKTVSRKSFIDK